MKLRRKCKVICYNCDGKGIGCHWCNFTGYMIISCTSKDMPYGAIEEVK